MIFLKNIHTPRFDGSDKYHLCVGNTSSSSRKLEEMDKTGKVFLEPQTVNYSDFFLHKVFDTMNIMTSCLTPSTPSCLIVITNSGLYHPVCCIHLFVYYQFVIQVSYYTRRCLYYPFYPPVLPSPPPSPPLTPTTAGGANLAPDLPADQNAAVLFTYSWRKAKLLNLTKRANMIFGKSRPCANKYGSKFKSSPYLAYNQSHISEEQKQNRC